MILCIDIGNSNLSAGVFKNDTLLLQFRYDSKRASTSDEIGIFLQNVLKQNKINYEEVSIIGIASVVPSLDYTIRAACIKYFHLEPIILKHGVKTGIQIKSNNPKEIGADLIAGTIAARKIFPNKDILIFDLGTATTCSYLNKEGEFLGSSIAPGFKTMMESLHSNTAQLFSVDIINPESAIGKNTKASIQSGIFYAQLGLINQLINQSILENNITNDLMVIATGGFSYIFEKTDCFDTIIPELVLLGIKYMAELNK